MTHYRIWRLRNQHRRLEHMIRAELLRRQPDWALIQDLKRRKLQVKDALFMAEAGLAPVTSVLNRA